MLYLGIAIVIGLMVATGVLSGKNGGSFGADRSAGAGLVSGALIGTFIGGASTVGTAQLAYTNGLSAWWFTLGGAIGLLLLLIFYYPLRRKNVVTIADAITSEYGKKSGTVLALLNSVGTFLSFVSQIISGAALVMTAVPALNFKGSVVAVCVLMIVYVIFGGAKALGRAGAVKTVIVTLSVVACGVIAIIKSGGAGFFLNNPTFPHGQYLDIFSRGILKDGGGGLSLVIGVLTTQSYVSAILSARSDRSAVGGTVLTVALVPVIGIFGIIAGMYMRANFPGIDAKQALPLFITEHMPPVAAGIMIGAILIAAVGTGAGLAFGISTMMYRNLYKPLSGKGSEKTVSRLILLLVVMIGLLICMLDLSDVILNWSFMSMGLRGAASLVPLVFALFLPKYIGTPTVICSMAGGAGFTLLGKFVLPESIDPMFLGLAAAIVIALCGMLIRKIKNNA